MPVDAARRAVRVRRIALGRPAVVVDEAQRQQARSRPAHRAARASANSARPSPCATAIGMREPSMPAKNSDGDFTTSTRLKRPSNCSERLRTKRGQCCVPGISSLQRRHHLAAVAHAERERVAAREECAERVAQRASGTESTSPSLRRRRARRRTRSRRRRPGRGSRSRLDAACEQIGHVHVERRRSRRDGTPPPSRPGC